MTTCIIVTIIPAVITSPPRSSPPSKPHLPHCHSYILRTFHVAISLHVLFFFFF